MERNSQINNAFYDTLQDDWYTALNHPVALLRQENAIRVPWVAKEIEKVFGNKPQRILDVGCGAGFLTNPLALRGHQVFGIDLSKPSLEIAKKHDETGKVNYRYANAYDLPFEKESFDIVCAMDILEHVEEPSRLISEAARVLKPKGMFFFHTFNRTFLSYILVIKGVDWFVKNAPPNMHVYELFIKPKELETLCAQSGLKVDFMKGFIPNIWTKAFWKLLLTREVPSDFKFTFSSDLMTGYCGVARKT